METLDIAIIGSGIGGSLSAALNKDKKIVVFEKDKNLGGCASTFKRYGSFFNAGATTFVGYEDGHILKNMFEKINFTPNITKSDIAYRVIQNNNIIDRTKDFETFLTNIDKVFPNKNNRVFWRTIKELDQNFWELKNIYYSKYSLKSYFKSGVFFLRLLFKFRKYLFKSADSFIKETLGEISLEYKEFIDAQVMITLQSRYKNIPLLSLALGLSYPFHDVFYVNGGMGSLFDDLLKDVDIRKKEEIIFIEKKKNYFYLRSTKNEYKAKNVILNSTVYDTKKLFNDKKIESYYDNFGYSDQSAFVVYMKLDTKKELLHHYQMIFDKKLPNTISNSFFISVSDKKDDKLSKEGYSITISTHTKASFWKNLSKDEYETKKKETEDFIKDKFLEYFNTIDDSNIKHIFSATSVTFNRYISRYNCGGRAMSFSNIISTPTAKTPFKGLYNVGDTVFAGQGWPGVALGVDVLNKDLNG